MLVISSKIIGYQLLHFLAEGGGFEHFDAVAMREQLAEEIGGGTDVEREVGVVVGGCQFALRVMQGQGAQVVRGEVVGTDDDMGHRRVIGQHTEILREIGL